MMNDYLAIVRRADFIDLFKYGQINISHAVKFSGDMKEHIQDDLLFDRLTARMNVYEYSFEYLIIHFVSDQEDGGDATVDIGTVQNIFALDELAKKEMSNRFDPRIQIQVSPWVDRFDCLHEKMLLKQCLRGVNNIWAIFGLPEKDMAKCKEIVPDDLVGEVFRQVYANEPLSGEQSLWTYLLRYERHSFYPKNMHGIFYDFIHVVCSWKCKSVVTEDDVTTTKIYPEIYNTADDKFQTLATLVSRSPLAEITQTATNCEFVTVAPLFLYLKSQFLGGMEHRPSGDYIAYVKSMGFAGELALYLLGITLGYDKTYDAFYDSARIPFFKKRIEPAQGGETDLPVRSSESDNHTVESSPSVDTASQNNELDVATETIMASDDSGNRSVSQKEPEHEAAIPSSPEAPKQETAIQQEMFPDRTEVNEPLPIMWVRKEGKGKREVRPVMSLEEKDKYLKEGFCPIERFVSKDKMAMIELNYDPDKEKRRLSKSKKDKKT